MLCVELIEGQTTNYILVLYEYESLRNFDLAYNSSSLLTKVVDPAGLSRRES